MAKLFDLVSSITVLSLAACNTAPKTIADHKLIKINGETVRVEIFALLNMPIDEVNAADGILQGHYQEVDIIVKCFGFPSHKKLGSFVFACNEIDINGNTIYHKSQTWSDGEVYAAFGFYIDQQSNQFPVSVKHYTTKYGALLTIYCGGVRFNADTTQVSLHDCYALKVDLVIVPKEDTYPDDWL